MGGRKAGGREAAGMVWRVASGRVAFPAGMRVVVMALAERRPLLPLGEGSPMVMQVA